MNGSPNRTADADGWTSAEIDEDYGNDLLNSVLRSNATTAASWTATA